MRLRFPRLRKKQEAAQPSVNVQQHGRAIDNTSTDTASAIGSRHQPASVLATSQSSEAHNVLPSKAGSAAVSLPTELNSTAADTGERHGPSLLGFISKHSDEDPGIISAREAWQQSLLSLDAAIAKPPALRSPHLEGDSIALALEKADAITRDHRSSGVFEQVIEQVLSEETTKSSQLTGKFGKCMSKVYPVAKVALEVVAFGSDAASFLPLKVAANGLSQVISLAMSEDTRRNDIIDELGRLSDHHQYVDSLRSLNFLSFKPLVSEKAIGLMTAINNFLTISILYLKANYMKKVTIGVIGEDKVEVSKLTLRAAAKEFNEAVEHESHFIIWKEEEARRTAKALDSLTKLNYKVIHSGYRKVLAEGSGKWFLEAPKFQKWLKGEQRCLWCPGLPGAGKTILTSLVVDRIIALCKADHNNSPLVGLAYIYCDYKNQANQSVEAVIRSLIRQLIESQTPLVTRLEDFLEETADISVDAGEYAKFLASLIQTFSRVYIVIDALDEFSSLDRIRRSLVKVLISLTNRLDVNCYLFLTSRPSEDVKEMFRTDAEISIVPSTQDISSYVDMRIADSEECTNWIQEEPDLLSRIKKAVNTKSDGIFLLARFQMDSLIEAESVGRLEDAIKELTSNLDDYYGIAIARIKSIPGGHAETAFALLSWICHAKQPLTVIEIQHALAIHPMVYSLARHRRYLIPSIGQVAGRCAGLVIIKDQGIIAYAHETVQKYIFTRKGELFPDAELGISRACLTYLHFDELKSGPAFSDEAFSRRLEKLPFLTYTATFWPDHLRGDLELQLLQPTLSFLKDRQYLNSAIQASYAYQNRGTESSQTFPRDLSSLHIAAANNLLHIALALLEQNSPVSPQSENGETPLYQAAEKCHEDMVRMLLAKGADPNIPGGDYGNALQAASRSDHPGFEQVKRVLLEHNAAIDVSTGGIGRIFERFPTAPAWLVARLGEADGLRREEIAYKEKHREVSHAVLEHLKDLKKPTRATTVYAIEQLEESDPSEITWTSSSISYTNNSEKVPFLDPSQYRSKFLCPFCSTIVSMPDQRSWKKHVFTDLKPYVCTSKHCDNSRFLSRRDWLQHENNHWKHWMCGHCDHVYSSTQPSWAEHMIEARHEHASREKVISKSRSKKRPVAHIIVRVELPGERCPFCDDKIGLERDSTKEDWSQEAMPHHVFPILRMKSHSTGSSNFVEEPRIDRPQRSKRSKVNFLPPSIEIPPLIDIFPTSIIPPARPDPVIDLDQDAVTLSDFQLAPGKFHRHVAIHQERFALSAMSNLQSRLKPESETESVHSSTSITVVKGSENDSDVAGSNSSRSSLVFEDFGREMIAEESPWGDSNVENG